MSRLLVDVGFRPFRPALRHPAARSGVALLSVAAAFFALPSLVLAYNPPVDKAEGVTVRIEAPERIEQAGDPIDVAVIVENAGEGPIAANLRIGLIDGWQADPGEFAAVSLPAGESRRLTARVQSAADSYAAHYPIHVWATVRRPDKP